MLVFPSSGWFSLVAQGFESRSIVYVKLEPDATSCMFSIFPIHGPHANLWTINVLHIIWQRIDQPCDIFEPDTDTPVVTPVSVVYRGGPHKLVVWASTGLV